jgi:peptide-methionine (S)-S-oxide reductase
MSIHRTKYLRGIISAGGVLALSAIAVMGPQHSASGEEMRVVPPLAGVEQHVQSEGSKETAIFAGGCFWGVQGVFQHVKGVASAVSGYSGGSKQTAFYPIVSTGATGHAEAVEITYDPSQISFGKLLQIYFSVVTDPTQLDAQGPDVGKQYRSEIFATTPEQAKTAETYIAQLKKAQVYRAPVVTKVSAYEAFYPAEGYHQDYLTNHPTDRYIAVNDMPKVEGLKKLFPQDYTQSAVLTATN